eukprot:9099170-Pyramimonas_sp.AAC.2
MSSLGSANWGARTASSCRPRPTSAFSRRGLSSRSGQTSRHWRLHSMTASVELGHIPGGACAACGN